MMGGGGRACGVSLCASDQRARVLVELCGGAHHRRSFSSPPSTSTTSWCRVASRLDGGRVRRGQAGGQPGRQAGRQAGRQTSRQTRRHAGKSRQGKDREARVRQTKLGFHWQAKPRAAIRAGPTTAGTGPIQIRDTATLEESLPSRHSPPLPVPGPPPVLWPPPPLFSRRKEERVDPLTPPPPPSVPPLTPPHKKPLKQAVTLRW